MSEKQIFDTEAKRVLTDDQVTAVTKSKHRFIFAQKSMPSSKVEKPVAEICDLQDCPKEFNSSLKNKLGRIHVKFSAIPKKRPVSPAQQAEDSQAVVIEDFIEVDWQPVEEDQAKSLNLSNRMREFLAKILPEDRYEVLTYQLLSYLNECLENGNDPDWDYITKGEEIEDGNFLLTASPKYIFYLMEHLLKDGYIEGFAVEANSDEKHLYITSGIQITPQGKKYLKENGAIGKIVTFLQAIKNSIPGI